MIIHGLFAAALKQSVALADEICVRTFGQLIFLVVCAWTVQAQTVSFRVFTEPPGAKFAVDGNIYTSSATFQWPAGSKHLVRYVQDLLPPSGSGDPGAPALTISQLSPDAGTVYAFQNWVDSNGILQGGTDPNQTITADPSVPWIKATVTISYRVILNFFDSPPGSLPSVCGAPGPAPQNQLRVGLVFLNSQCYWNSGILYFPANSVLNLNAFPYPGFVFLGWSGVGIPNSFLQTYTLKGPITLAPTFSPAKRVRFETNPIGLQVLVDRTPTPTLTSTDPTSPCPHNEGLPVTVLSSFTALCRGDFDFAPGSQHLVGAPSPQNDLSGKTWVFDSWGNGQGQNAIYNADQQTSTSDTVVVNFIRAAQASFVTSPPGLKLTIDGRSNWPGYNFVWGQGSTHQITAPAEQTNSQGRKYTFRGWSNAGTATQTLTMDQASVDSGFRLVANYDGLSRVVVQTSPAGQKVQIEGADCVTPCTVDRANGSQIRVTAPVSIGVSDQTRLDLASWSDGGPADHTFTIASDSQTLTASYVTSYRLSAGSDPANGAIYHLDPQSPDQFYPADSQVSVSAEARPGFKFRRWAGDLAGTYPSGTLTMSSPHGVTALLDRVPYIAPAGVKNAAGDTPDAVVAPGSLIAIAGESLATDTVQGRVNPLAQTLAGVTVTLGDRLLPLVSVSPQQVVALLPSDLSEGDYTLQVHSDGQPDVSGNFTVARNAPGLFAANVSHQDGTPVTSDSPAIRGETITILGTGFGPYATPVIDGFFPFDPAPAVSDPVDVLSADQTLQAAWVGAASGYSGMTALKLKIADPLPSGAAVPIQVRVNGRLSNTIALPIS